MACLQQFKIQLDERLPKQANYSKENKGGWIIDFEVTIYMFYTFLHACQIQNYVFSLCHPKFQSSRK